MTKDTDFKCDKPFAVHPKHGPCVQHMGFMHMGPLHADRKTRGAWPHEELTVGRKPSGDKK